MDESKLSDPSCQQSFPFNGGKRRENVPSNCPNFSNEGNSRRRRGREREREVGPSPVLLSSSELIGSLKLGNVWVFSADFWSSFAYESAEQKLEDCLT